MEKTFKLLGLSGVIALLSYSAMVFISPIVYPGYNCMTMAVSELSAAGSPSQTLANQLNALFGPCSVLSITLVFIASRKSKVKLFRLGITLFTLMEWICATGYEMFPWVSGVDKLIFQNFMHLAVTVAVVVLSLSSLILLAISSKRVGLKSLGLWAIIALTAMLIGPIGTSFMPPSVFGLFERFSTFSAVVFNAILGVYIFKGRFTSII